MRLPKIVKDNLTDYDGSTYDTGRCIAWFCVASLTIMQGFAVAKGGAFDPMAYGGGVAAVIACLGVAIFGDNARRP